ncbi:MAG: MBL fold metallo-hydrolase [Betaproteobacteria bacterium]|nr:MAG: MBL fold metallo-hydrolase [Betaproteobacteria bacterium]
MRFASLGSGSGGNAMLICAGDTTVMLDCGFSVAETKRRLARVGVCPEQLDAIVVTHEHDDHIGGVARFARRHDVPVWMSHGTWRGFEAMFDDVRLNLVEGYTAFSVGGLQVEPFPVPHDAREPAQFVFGDGSVHLGVLTDTGESTPHIETMLSRCDGLVIECNHDLEMLARSNYPPALRARISSRVGHLDNTAAAQLLSRVAGPGLQHVIAAHLSQQNNCASLAQRALSQALGCDPQWIGVADQDSGFDWRELR